jgi:ATP-dependent Lon protease
MKFLIVDDEKLLLDLFKDEIMLTFDGAEVFTAGNGVEALEVLEDKEIDVILTDGRMPQMSGVELAKTVREKWPHIPLVLLTGYSGISDDALKEELFDLNLKKPIRFDILSQHLEDLIAKRKQS